MKIFEFKTKIFEFQMKIFEFKMKIFEFKMNKVLILLLTSVTQKNVPNTVVLGWPQASWGLLLRQRVFCFFSPELVRDLTKILGDTVGSFFFTRIGSRPYQNFGTYRRVFLFHQNWFENQCYQFSVSCGQSRITF